MLTDLEKIRLNILNLLELTRRETCSALSGIDPELVVHHDDRAWKMRDILGHIGVWNGEAARSLLAHAGGGEYHCLPEEKYDEYNGKAAEERRAWEMKQVWAEYEASSDQLKFFIESMPAEGWEREILYPWNELGSVQSLIEIMMKHEAQHRQAITLMIRPAEPA
jgi:hypothetical protein